MISCRWQEAFQFAIFIFQASATTAHCTMKIDFQTIFTTAVTTRMFMVEDMTLSTGGAVHVVFTVIIADSWSGSWGRWWRKRRRGWFIQVEGGEGWHLRPPQRHDMASTGGKAPRYLKKPKKDQQVLKETKGIKSSHKYPKEPKKYQTCLLYTSPSPRD